MPIFEYLCDDCGTKFEKLVRRAAESADVGCPSCGQTHVTTQVSSFAARANGAKQDTMPSCPAGMCGNPGFCGRN
ncbi:MAG: zinc ribbon domain-containing protein [Bryobacterales bacterium]|nr:zinc ribbon domain-containing protein [Bryobacterales bacterium]